MAVSPLRLDAALRDADADRTRAARLARELEAARAAAAPGPVLVSQRWTDAQVMALIAERDAALAALREVAERCHPHGVSPMVLRRGDSPWPRVADLLWGPAP